MVSFWDEDPNLLRSCFDGMTKLGVTHVVAVDGVLDLYPGGESNSAVYKHKIILEMTEARGMDLLLYRNQERWTGNEVGKRQFMLDLALAITTAEDWLLVWDTDYVLLEPFHPRYLLEHTDLNFADVSYGEDPDHLYHARLLMRAQTGLQLRTNHYAYYEDLTDVIGSWFLPDNRRDGGENPQALDLTKLIRVHHDHSLRPQERLDGRTVFYERRDEQKVEW
jgi:hypothetical protein